MRDYGKVVPTFWTRGSGKALRGDPCAQVVAVYLFSCPTSHVTGLFYMPFPVLCHETGLSAEQATSALTRLAEAGIAHYDAAADLVWLPEMAHYQIAESMKAEDRRVRGVEKAIEKFRGHPFFEAFLCRYSEAYSLTEARPLVRVTEGPYQAPLSSLPDLTLDLSSGSDPERAKINSHANETAVADASDPAPSALVGAGTPSLPPAESKPARGSKGTRKAAKRASKPDVDPNSLTHSERVVYNAVIADPSFVTTVPRPAELARDLVRAGAGVDIPTQVIEAGNWTRRDEKNERPNGTAFLQNWIKRAKQFGETAASSGSRGLPLFQGGDYDPVATRATQDRMQKMRDELYSGEDFV